MKRCRLPDSQGLGQTSDQDSNACETTDDDPPEILSAEGHRAQRRRPRVTTIKQSRHRTLDDHELLARVETRIRQLYEDGSIVVEDGREYFAGDAYERREELRRRRDALERKLGPTQVMGGAVFEIRLNGKAYSFAPYLEWLFQFLSTMNYELPTSKGRHALRNRLIWLLWHFRHRAKIEVGRTEHKVRGPFVTCTNCNYRHRYLSRRRNSSGSYCRKCGEEQHRAIPEKLDRKPFGRITKAELMRRFRLPERTLDRLLLAPLPPAAPASRFLLL